ncbi:N-acetyl-gamma-glutamyl-phosphate reductase [Portibacter marinus]|uniref:N-acetyl-gamma-glutamyl-phosphate reductase n=1 Tax=Portibacter marinus TaxID=2898660 RepID=UPI001F2D5D9B|nr:N-acetyl-gamma-glutamyl-phosphate reductase [Portibacter marinus]
MDSRSTKYRVGVVGGTGFTGGELLRILLHHPHVQISWIFSRNHASKPVSSVHLDLEGHLNDVFVDQCDWEIDVVFLCLPHETARDFVNASNIPQEVKIIDLSRDYRLEPNHENFIYGLPELNRKKVKSAKNIANPGCFATAIQLALLPLAHQKILLHDVHITGITGSTGAGKGLSETTHFTWRTGNVSVYKALKHQHISEIRQSLTQLQPGFSQRLNFIPIRGNFTRGILASIYTESEWSSDDVLQLYEKYFEEHPFVRVTDLPVDLKQVVGTNMVRISVNVIDGMVHLVSVIDNLVKGASGQAIQNMNLMFGLPEQIGLELKSIAY